IITALAYFSYFSFIFFIIALVFNMKKYALTPAHLRWELYPVPGEEGHKHGGSFLEKVDWWRGSVKINIMTELSELFQEMLFIKRLYRSKRRFWVLSFLFHGGIYLILGWFVLIFIGGVEALMRVPVTSSMYAAIFYVTISFGYVGISAATIGGIGLAIKRYYDVKLRDLSSPIDYFNLIFALVVMVSGIFALIYDPLFNTARTFMAYLLSGAGYIFSFNYSIRIYPAMILQLVLLCSFLIYVPFSRLTHFLGKYFTYHKVLWNSQPSMQLGKFNDDYDLTDNLNLIIPWSGTHIPTGKKWKEVRENEKSN
ncbi:MAG: respiratory nitrate reductase subunit gamma, partial [Conexivisphaerales archaeon]